MALPMKAKPRPRGQNQVGRSPVMLGQRRGKAAFELRSFATRFQNQPVIRPVSGRSRGGSFAPSHMRGIDTSRLNTRGLAAVSQARIRPVVANAVPRFSDIVGSIGAAIRQPTIRTGALAVGTKTSGDNIRVQLGNMNRARTLARRGVLNRQTTDKFKFGVQQVGRIVARKHGTPTGYGLPKFVRGRLQ